MESVSRSYVYDDANVLNVSLVQDLQQLMSRKTVVDDSQICYFCTKTQEEIVRGRTRAEHITGSIKLADYLLGSFDEFAVNEQEKAELFSAFLGSQRFDLSACLDNQYHDVCDDVDVASFVVCVRGLETMCNDLKYLSDDYLGVFGNQDRLDKIFSGLAFSSVLTGCFRTLVQSAYEKMLTLECFDMRDFHYFGVFDGDGLVDAVRDDFLKFQRVLDINTVSRSGTNRYDVDDKQIDRKETDGEHLHGGLGLIEYLLDNEEEFAPLKQYRAEIFSVFLSHDDCEIITTDTNIADEIMRSIKDKEERAAIPALASQYPVFSGAQLIKYDALYRGDFEGGDIYDLIVRFCKAIDKLEPLVHELKYPEDRGASKRFGKKDIIRRQGPYVSYSPTFTTYLNTLIKYMDDTGGYFDEDE